MDPNNAGMDPALAQNRGTPPNPNQTPDQVPVHQSTPIQGTRGKTQPNQVTERLNEEDAFARSTLTDRSPNPPVLNEDLFLSDDSTHDTLMIDERTVVSEGGNGTQDRPQGTEPLNESEGREPTIDTEREARLIEAQAPRHTDTENTQTEPQTQRHNTIHNMKDNTQNPTQHGTTEASDNGVENRTQTQRTTRNGTQNDEQSRSHQTYAQTARENGTFNFRRDTLCPMRTHPEAEDSEEGRHAATAKETLLLLSGIIPDRQRGEDLPFLLLAFQLAEAILVKSGLTEPGGNAIELVGVQTHDRTSRVVVKMRTARMARALVQHPEVPVQRFRSEANVKFEYALKEKPLFVAIQDVRYPTYSKRDIKNALEPLVDEIIQIHPVTVTLGSVRVERFDKWEALIVPKNARALPAFLAVHSKEEGTTAALPMYHPFRGIACVICKGRGHVAGRCPERFCKNCRGKGHKETACRLPCAKCGSDLHKISRCRTPDEQDEDTQVGRQPQQGFRGRREQGGGRMNRQPENRESSDPDPGRDRSPGSEARGPNLSWIEETELAEARDRQGSQEQRPEETENEENRGTIGSHSQMEARQPEDRNTQEGMDTVSEGSDLTNPGSAEGAAETGASPDHIKVDQENKCLRSLLESAIQNPDERPGPAFFAHSVKPEVRDHLPILLPPCSGIMVQIMQLHGVGDWVRMARHQRAYLWPPRPQNMLRNWLDTILKDEIRQYFVDMFLSETFSVHGASQLANETPVLDQRRRSTRQKRSAADMPDSPNTGDPVTKRHSQE